MKIAAPHLANLLTYASAIGIDAGDLKQRHLTDPGMDLSLPQNSLSDAELTEVVKDMTARTKDHFFGLHYGCFMNIKAMGLIYQISKSATEAEQVILFLKDFLEKTFPVFEVTVKQKQEDVLIELSCQISDPGVKRHLTDASISILYRELKLILSSSCKTAVCFPVQNSDEYKKLLGPEVREGAAHAISFDRSSLNAALNQNSLFRLGELLPAFLLLLESGQGNGNFPDRVRKMVLHMSTPELPELEKVASQFCMSARTFQRKLTAEGKSFRTISDEIKRDLSACLHKNKSLKTQDIAFLLGYSGASAYLHAAGKWKSAARFH